MRRTRRKRGRDDPQAGDGHARAAAPDDFPQQVRNIVARALSLVPSARFKTALDMHKAIDDLGLCADAASVAAFVEIHLKDRLAKRKAAIDIALKAAADRTNQPLGDLFPSRSPRATAIAAIACPDYSGGGPPSGSSSTSNNSHVGMPTIVDLSGVSHYHRGRSYLRGCHRNRCAGSGRSRWAWGRSASS